MFAKCDVKGRNRRFDGQSGVRLWPVSILQTFEIESACTESKLHLSHVHSSMDALIMVTWKAIVNHAHGQNIWNL